MNLQELIAQLDTALTQQLSLTQIAKIDTKELEGIRKGLRGLQRHLNVIDEVLEIDELADFIEDCMAED